MTPADKPDLPEGTPERIYLQISNDDADEQPVVRFQDLGEVTWCEDQIGSTDPEYIRADVVQRLLADERRKALEEAEARLRQRLDAAKHSYAISQGPYSEGMRDAYDVAVLDIQSMIDRKEPTT